MDFNSNYDSKRNSNTLTLDDNDLLDDEWLYTSEPFNRTATFRRKVKNNGESSRNSILEWLATDDDKPADIPADNSSVDLEDISRQRKKTDSIDLFDNNEIFKNADSLFDDDLDISNLDSKFMSNFKLVNQDDFEDTEIEESITKNNIGSEIHRCDSPNTEINLIDASKIGNNETNIEDNDSDSNMTIINSTNKNKLEGLTEIEKNAEIVKIDKLDVEKSTEIEKENKLEDKNKLDEKKLEDEKLNIDQNIEKPKENKTVVFNEEMKSNLLKKSELAQKRFLAKVEEAKKTLENLKPRKDSLSSSESELNIKTPTLNDNKMHEDTKKEEKINKRKIERRSYYYYADTGSDDEKEDKNSSISINKRKASVDHGDSHSGSFKKTFNYFNSGGADSSFYGDSIYNNNESSFISTSSAFSLPSAQLSSRYNDDVEDYPRKPPAPSSSYNGNILSGLIDHKNFDNQSNYHSDIDAESNSSFYSDLQPPEYYRSNYGHSKSSLGYYSTSPKSPVLKSKSLYGSSSPTLKPSTSFIPASPSLKANTSSYIPSSPSLKPNKTSTSFIPSSPSMKPKTSFIPSSPSLKAARPSSPSVGKYSTSSLYNKQKSHIASPRIGYSSPSSPTPYSKSYESRSYDPVAPVYSVKDLINNKSPQILSHSGSINSISNKSYSRKSSLEQTPQLKSYLNKMATAQRSKSPSVMSTTSTSSSKYSSGRKTPSSRLGNYYAENSVGTSTTSASTSKIYSKYKSSISSSSSISKIGSGIPSSSSSADRKISSSIPSSSSRMSFINGGYSGRLSKTPTPSSYSKYSTENQSRIPSPSPYSKRSITPYY